MMWILIRQRVLPFMPIVVLMCTLGSVEAQYPLYWVAPLSLEAGVPFVKTRPVGRVTIGCSVDDYTNVVFWGDGTSSLLSTPGAPHAIYWNGAWRTVVGPGTFDLWADADKQYSQNNKPLSASIKSTLHCLDGTEIAHWQVNASINIYPRTPIDSIDLSPVTVKEGRASMLEIKGGAAFAVTIKITDLAPPSNTQVDLSWTGAVNLLVSPQPSIDIPDRLNNKTFVVKTLKTNKRQTVTLTATSLTSKQATINITP